MTTRRRGTQHTCKPAPPPQTLSIVTAFVLVLIPDHDGSPDPIDAEELTDSFYECGERTCGCPPAVGSRQWKVKRARPGGAFDGRVTGQPSVAVEWATMLRTMLAKTEAFDAAREEWNDAHSRNWGRNTVRPLELQGPPSCFAIITPDAVWHECIIAEPHDLLVGPSKGGQYVDFLDRYQELTAVQVAWRFTVAEFLMRYQHCWLVGMDVSLAAAVTRDCVQCN